MKAKFQEPESHRKKSAPRSDSVAPSPRKGGGAFKPRNRRRQRRAEMIAARGWGYKRRRENRWRRLEKDVRPRDPVTNQLIGIPNEATS